MDHRSRTKAYESFEVRILYLMVTDK